jgi:hypothetical protein
MKILERICNANSSTLIKIIPYKLALLWSMSQFRSILVDMRLCPVYGFTHGPQILSLPMKIWFLFEVVQAFPFQLLGYQADGKQDKTCLSFRECAIYPCFESVTVLRCYGTNSTIKLEYMPNRK